MVDPLVRFGRQAGLGRRQRLLWNYRVTVDGKSTIVDFPKSAGAKLVDID